MREREGGRREEIHSLMENTHSYRGSEGAESQKEGGRE